MVKKLKISTDVFFFYKKILDIFFDGVLNRKESFVDYQSVILTKSKKLAFVQRGKKKKMKFLLSFFFLQKWLDMLVDSIGRFYARDVKVV